MMARKAKAVWLECGICSHVFKRKSRRQFKCEHCGAHMTRQAKEPSKACPCWSCRRGEKPQ